MLKVFEDLIQKNLGFLKKMPDMVYEASLGMLKAYQEKTVELAKLKAAEMYVRGVQAARKQVLAVVGVIYLTVLAASATAMVCVGMVMLAPWSRQTKLILLALVGMITIAVPLAVVARFFSEKKWIEFSHSKEIMDGLVRNGRD